MPIKIERITAKNLGPIKNDLNINLKNINLIYSKNEGGKSFITELIIRCLFKKPEEFGYIRNSGIGKIFISGINEKILEFSTSSKFKFENLFEKEFQDLPFSFPKLLIVKSGEVELIKEKNNYTGINKQLIKELLSTQRILDKIIGKIPITAREADIRDNIINASRKGEFKTYYELKNNYENIKILINKIIDKYNTLEYSELKLIEKTLEEERQKLLKAKRFKAYKLYCKIKELNETLQKLPENNIKIIEEKINDYKNIKNEINNLNERINLKAEKLKVLPEITSKYKQQEKAKKFLAYSLYQKIQEKEIDLKKLSIERINKLETDIKLYTQASEEYKKLEYIINNLKHKTKDYNWIEGIRNNILQIELESKKKLNIPDIILLILSIIIGLSGIIAGIIFKKYITGLLLLLASFLISILFNFKKINKKELLKKIENDIKNSFKEKFNDEFSFDKLFEKHDELSKNLQELQTYEKRFIEVDQNLKNIKYQIVETFFSIINKKPEDNEWDKLLNIIKDERYKIEQEKDTLKQQFNKLDIDQTEFVKEDPGITYKKEEYESLYKQLNELELINLEKQKEEEDYTKKNNNIKELIKEIKTELLKLLQTEPDENQFEIVIAEIKTRIAAIREEIKITEGELKGLGIDEKDFSTEPAEIDFSNEKMKEIENQLEDVRTKLGQIEENLNSIKSEICKITDDDFTTDFNTLINNLYKKEIEVKNELIKLESRLSAQIITFKVIDRLQKEEDKKIVEILESSDFSDLLLKFTGKYNKITIKEENQEEKLYLSTDIEEFKLDDISTGTKEQVFLALRLAFARRILKNKTAFLLLDDAFQHSDYDRRHLLINTLYEIASNGWQIIYLTMDDHIKKTFEEKANLLNYDLNVICL